MGRLIRVHIIYQSSSNLLHTREFGKIDLYVKFKDMYGKDFKRSNHLCKYGSA